MTEASIVAFAAAMNVNTSSSMAGVLIDGILHLTKHVVNLNQVLLGSGIGHGQVVLLSQRVLGNSRTAAAATTSTAHAVSWLRHVLFSGHWAVGHGQRSVKRQQRAANVGVRVGINVSALGASEEVVNHVVSALTVIASRSSVVTNVLSARGVQRRLIEVHAIASRSLGRIVSAMVTGLRVSAGSHLAIVIIVAGSLGLRSVVEAAMHVMAGSGQNRVVGVGLDVLLEILRALEGLAAELALVGFERNVDANVRSDVITLDGGCSARVPLASEAQVVGALATDVALANMFLVGVS